MKCFIFRAGNIQGSYEKKDPSSSLLQPQIFWSTLYIDTHAVMTSNLTCVTTTHLLQILVTVDELALMRVLQFVGLHILPQSLDDDRSGLGVDPKHTSQPGVQLKLRGLDGKKRQERAFRFCLMGACSIPTLLRSMNNEHFYLVVQHEQHGAAYTHIARPLHLETVRLLSGGGPVPLKSNQYSFITVHYLYFTNRINLAFC